MDDLTFERVHRFKINGFAVVLHIVDRIHSEITQVLAFALEIPIDVNDQVGTLAGLLLHGQTRELLQSIDDLTVMANQVLDVFVIVGHDLHGWPVVANTHFDITVVIGDIKQALEIVGRDIRFFVELLDRFRFILSHMYSFIRHNA